MSRKTIKAFESHTGRKAPGAQGVTFRDAAKPGLGPSLRADELERELAEHPEADGKNVRREIRELRAQAQRAADAKGLCVDCGMSEFAHEKGCAFWEREARRAFEAQERNRNSVPTLPPPPASIERACLLARAQELEDLGRMLLARAAELREVAGR